MAWWQIVVMVSIIEVVTTICLLLVVGFIQSK